MKQPKMDVVERESLLRRSGIKRVQRKKGTDMVPLQVKTRVKPGVLAFGRRRIVAVVAIVVNNNSACNDSSTDANGQSGC